MTTSFIYNAPSQRIMALHNNLYFDPLLSNAFICFVNVSFFILSFLIIRSINLKTGKKQQINIWILLNPDVDRDLAFRREEGQNKMLLCPLKEFLRIDDRELKEY